MCDIGRFDYHWIEGGERLARPLERDESGSLRAISWHELMPRLVDRLTAAGRSDPAGVRFLLSAHASHEELFLFQRLTDELLGESTPEEPAITIGWRVTPKSQPEHTTFKVPAVDAPNVSGARMMGLLGRVSRPQDPTDDAVRLPAPSVVESPSAVDGKPDTTIRDARNVDEAADISELRAAVEAGRVSALYVFDPGPDGSLGDTTWVLEARAGGKLRLLIVQGVLLTALARAADFVLPGASYVEKEASYTNDGGRLQGTSRALPVPGDAMDDWQILVNLAVALGLLADYAGPADVRRAIAERFHDVAGFEGITALTFARPIPAAHWLQASNPSERWKWDFMFQDLPPVKGDVDPSSLPPSPGVIPLREVT
jgi:anaerobic selenocysteine-containing dehydrogenase